ncbi:lymphotoxin-alpha isoform 2-T2 [Sarcophilus harrisii]
MTSSGVLCLVGALSLHALWLQPPEAQGAPNLDNSHSSRPALPQTAQQFSQKSLIRDTLKPAAHLVGDFSAKDSIHWRASTDHAFLRHGFSLRNNSLLVPTSGLYFIYSQVVFSGTSCSQFQRSTSSLSASNMVSFLSSTSLLYNLQRRNSGWFEDTPEWGLR